MERLWRTWSCSLGGRDRTSWTMYLKAMIVLTWSVWSSEFGDAVEGRDRVNSEMYLEAVIVRVWRGTQRPWSIEIGGVPGGGRSDGSRSRRRCVRSWDSIQWLTHDCGNVQNWVQQGPPRVERSETGWEGETVDLRMMQYSVYAILGVCRTRCMQCSVYAVITVNS